MVLDFDRDQLDAKFIDTNGQIIDYFTMVKGTVVSAPQHLTSNLSLRPGAPNPFVHRTRIAYSLPRSGPVSIALYDTRGRLMKTLVDEVQSAGEHVVQWEGRDSRGREVPLGVYYVLMQFADQSRTHKIVLTE